MKKVILLSLGVMFLAVLGTSCKKECTCTTSSSIEGTADIVQTVETKEKCSDMNTSTTANGITVDYTCE